jgi:hypothetical protein
MDTFLPVTLNRLGPPWSVQVIVESHNWVGFGGTAVPGQLYVFRGEFSDRKRLYGTNGRNDPVRAWHLPVECIVGVPLKSYLSAS